jgi:hypothetical protein
MKCFLCGHLRTAHVDGACCLLNWKLARCPCTEFIPCVEPGQVWECREEVRMRQHDGDMDGHIFRPGDRIIAAHPDPIYRRPHWIINFFGVSYQAYVDIIYNYFQLV